MPQKNATPPTITSISNLLGTVIGESTVDRIARECGMMRRKRDVTPLTLLVSCLSTLGCGTSRWLADILRTFNELSGKSVQYKPFHNQLRKPAFAEFSRRMLNEVLQSLTMPILEAIDQDKLAMFDDIVLHDGTSFALMNKLKRDFPGRFTKVSPAAVELHVTMSVLEDNVTSIVLAPDKESERDCAPNPEDVAGCLLLEDRGYEAKKTFIDIDNAGGFFIVRGNTTIKPIIITARTEDSRRLRHLEGKHLRINKLPSTNIDLDIEWGSGNQTWRGRLVVLFRRGKRNKGQFTLLHTNLCRNVFALAEVGQCYRLRWQVELLFKQWKSHANLRRFETANPAIAEAMIWMSLLTATLCRFVTHAAERVLRVPLSTLRVARAARHLIDPILHSLLKNLRKLPATLARAFDFMKRNTQRAHPKRDAKKGRLTAGLKHLALP